MATRTARPSPLRPSSIVKVACEREHSAPGGLSVLVVSLSPSGHEPHDNGALSALTEQLGATGAYHLRTEVAADAGEVERLVLSQRPRLLLLDMRLVEAIGAASSLRQVNRHSRGTYWLMLWDSPTLRGFELAIACQAHGCIEWQAGVEHFMLAFRTVIAGDLWFPRRAMRWLCSSLLADLQPASSPSERAIDEAPMRSQPHLTKRELQVMELMRKGLTNKDIAARLGISINTIKKHLSSAFEKRGVRHRRQMTG